MGIEPYLKERLLCRNKKYLFCYDRGFFILRDSTDKTFIQKLRIHPALKSLSLVERLLRYDPRTAISLDVDTFLCSAHGYIYNYSVADNRIIIEHRFKKGMNNPLTFCTRYDENGNLVDLLYGEYIWNTEKGPVSIYRRKQEGWKEVYSFPAGMIEHIHNIFFDKYRNRYLILTGDGDDQSGIWEADLEFRSVKPIVKGSQKYRSCVAYPTQEGIYYGTDTPLRQNYLYKLTENDGEVALLMLYEMPGPCIFGEVVGDVLYMATSVEGNPDLGGLRYKLSNKLGEGVKDRYTHIIRCVDGDISEIEKIEKDFWPIWLFQFGNAKFPLSDDGKVYICPQSCKCKYGTYIVGE